MKNIVENVALMLVVVFSIAIVVLIVQYNLLEDENIEYLDQGTSVVKKLSKEQETTEYLKELESYKEVNSKVNPRQESHLNQVKVKPEITKDKLNALIESKEKPKSTRIDEIGNALDKLLN